MHSVGAVAAALIVLLGAPRVFSDATEQWKAGTPYHGAWSTVAEQEADFDSILDRNNRPLFPATRYLHSGALLSQHHSTCTKTLQLLLMRSRTE